MKKQLQEEDFDFRKRIKKSSPYEDLNFLYTGIVTITTGLFLSLCMLMFPANNTNVKTTINPASSQDSIQAIDFKSINSSSISSIQNSIKDIFNISAFMYPDKASVRLGLNDEKLNTLQGKLFEKILMNVKNTHFSEPLSVGTNVEKISLLSFDSSTKTMTFEVNYSLNIHSNDNDGIPNFIKNSHGISQIQVSLDDLSNLKSIDLVHII